MSTALQLGISLALGIAGWIATSFVGAPVKDFFNLRQKIRRALYAHALVLFEGPRPLDAIMDRDASGRGIAETELKELGLELGALWSSRTWTRWILMAFRYDGGTAARAMIDLARGARGTGGMIIPGTKAEVERALRLQDK